jgi:inhibitor of cysteine peptidase
MKKIVCLICCFCIAASLAGCSQGNKTVKIKLEGNPTTGYTWEYEMSPDGIVREVSNDYASDSSAVGSGGTFTFVFEGVAPGEAVLTFSYLRPWEEDEPPLETAVYKITVDANNRLTMAQE